MDEPLYRPSASTSSSAVAVPEKFCCSGGQAPMFTFDTSGFAITVAIRFLRDLFTKVGILQTHLDSSCAAGITAMEPVADVTLESPVSSSTGLPSRMPAEERGARVA